MLLFNEYLLILMTTFFLENKFGKLLEVNKWIDKYFCTH
jgi:hypothetical protein